jgi:hypothetical protein
MAKMKHNFRYWLAEEALDHLQDFITYPVRKLYDIKYYINNRWVSRTHALTASPRDIKPGDWSDVSGRILPCLFNELVDFVEIETAGHHLACDRDARKKYDSPFYASGWFKWRVWRSPAAGLDHLDWASSLVFKEDWGTDPTDPNYGQPTSQAIGAREIKELYIWWTQVYRNRPDPHDASGWSAYCEAKRLASNDDSVFALFSEAETDELRAQGSIALAETSRIEAEYEKEDTEMMIRLIKVRHHLWT